uniref:Uncharacterized protein n=1 Tax=Sarcophilus harrisii TaxID=9305 RepID=A0A7N4PYJ4_SARHA
GSSGGKLTFGAGTKLTVKA